MLTAEIGQIIKQLACTSGIRLKVRVPVTCGGRGGLAAVRVSLVTARLGSKGGPPPGDAATHTH